jgi:ABC-type multidrug transport system fused ATPase/permease subunit
LEIPTLPPDVFITQNPKDKPLPPEESLRRITVPNGFNVSLFVGEPNVMQPIAFDFDDRGRLWVDSEVGNYHSTMETLIEGALLAIVAVVLAAVCVGLVLLYAVLAIVSVVNNATTITIGQGMVNDFRLDLYQHLQRLSLRFHSGREVGDLLYRVTADTFAIQTLSMNGVFPIITSTTMFVGMVAVMLRIDWQLTLVALAVCPVIFVGISRMGRRITAVATDARQKESRLYSITQRGISAIRIIQAFTPSILQFKPNHPVINKLLLLEGPLFGFDTAIA